MTRHDDLANRQERLSPEKRALLQRRLEGSIGGVRAEQPIPRRPDTGAPVLSFSQQRLWFLDRLEPGRPTYNIPYAIRWRGPLRRDLLERALGEIVARHEVLRTTFMIAGDSPVQRIVSPGPVSLPVTELESLSPEQRRKESARLAAEEADAPFDLAQGPLMRGRLLRCGSDEHLLLLTFHHIIFDGSSDPVFFEELRSLYDAFASGNPSPLPDLPVQYADFAVWQRGRLERDMLARELAYWKETLGGELRPMELPAEYTRPAVRGYAGGVERLALAEDVHAGLRKLSGGEGATLFMTLLAAFDVFLARLTGKDEVLVGTPIAGRVHPSTERLIGFFVNTLVLRTDLSGNPTFREAVQRTRKTALGALDHQEIPFEKLVEELHPAREQSRSPLFDVMFTLQHKGDDRRAPGGVVWTDESPDLRAAKLDLALTFQESDRGLLAVMEYRTDLFSPGTVRRWLGHLDVLLRSVVAHPDRPIMELRLLDDREEGAILALGRGSVLPYPVEQTYDRAFASRVRETPGAIAVVMGEERLTYNELDGRGNRLANVLRSLGARPETLVAICMEPSISLPVAYIGILKSGAAFVPMDPAYPDDRLVYMIEDADIAILVTERKHVPRIPRNVIHVICLDDESYRAELSAGDSAPASEATPESTAYVIYTSGSTGQPKGVLVSHRSLLNHNFGVIQIIGLTPDDRVLQFFSLSFDASIEDFFPTWLAGATLVLRPEGVTVTIARFRAFLEAERITVVYLPTAYWHEMADQGDSLTLPPSIRIVGMGGEQALGRKLALWRKRISGDVRVINLYGPTEATIAATYCEIQELSSEGILPIGRPFPNVQITICDRGGQLVPRGVPGEIVIGGAGVAKGYLNRDELTGEKFIEDRFAVTFGGRLYRTGDRGRFREDGNIEFLGRLDAQVKIRGYRIEPGEVEFAIGTHPMVSQCVVTAGGDDGEVSALIAYVVPHAGGEGPGLAGDVASWLKARLPDYMIPSVIVPLGSLPHLPNGKVDMKRLPVPGIDAVRPAEGFVAPRTPMEVQLARLWEEVLGKKPVGVFDNFFALGGHSFLAARLFARLEQLTGRNLPLATLFQAPTIDALASLLRQEGWTAHWSSLVPIKPSGSRRPLYCVHAAGGNVLGYTDLAARLDPEQPVYGLQARGLDGNEVPLDRVEDQAAAYVSEIRGFQPEGPYVLAGACTGGIVAYEMAQQLREAGQEVAFLAIFDAFAPGTLDAMSAEEVRKFRRDRTLARVTYHVSNLLLRPGRRAYAWKKFKTLRRRAKSRIWGLVYRMYARSAQPLPAALRKVEEYNIVAIRNYEPRPYPGRVTLFPPKVKSLGEPSDTRQGWGRLALGGVEIHEVDGDHLSMLRAPLVESVAKELSACLRQGTDSHAL